MTFVGQGAFVIFHFGTPQPLGGLRLSGATAPFAPFGQPLPYSSIGNFRLGGSSLTGEQVLSMLPNPVATPSTAVIIENNPNLCAADVAAVLTRLGLPQNAPGLIIANNGANCP